MQPDFVSQSVNLATDVLNWILIIIPIAAGAMIAYHSLRKILSDGEAGERAERDKHIKTILISAVIAFVGLGIVRLVVGYYS